MKILWASPNTLLDTANGAALMVRECLRQLALRGCEIKIIGSTSFVNEQGMKSRLGTWQHLERRKGSFVDVRDGILIHRTLSTEQHRRRLMRSYEENLWFREYQQCLRDFSPDVVLFFDNSLITLLTCSEAKRFNAKVGVFLMHSQNRGMEWCRDVDFMLTDTLATAAMYEKREGYRMYAIGTFVSPDQIMAAERQPQNLLMINPTPAKGGVLMAQLALWLTTNRPDIPIEVVDARNTWLHLSCNVAARLHSPAGSLTRVLVTNNTVDMKSIYQRAKVVLVPSLWWDSGPRVVIESMMNQIPVIASDSGGIPELLRDAGCVLHIPSELRHHPYEKLFPESVVMEWAKQICLLYDDRDHYQSMSAKSYSSWSQHHDINVNSDQLYTLLERLIARS